MTTFPAATESSTSAGARPKRIGQIAINVQDLQRAIVFYRDVVGLAYLFEIPQAAFFRSGETRIMLGIAEEPRFQHAASVIYYEVDDLKGAHRAMVEKGAACESEPHLIARMPDHELWMAFFRDTEENVFALMSEVRA